MKYVSYRDIPLLCQDPDEHGRPTVTMENYCKWYGVFILHADGSVTQVPIEDIVEILDKAEGILMIDHCYHPQLLHEIAKKIGGVADSLSLEVTAGRWVIEIMDGKLMPHHPDITGEDYE